VIDRDMFTFTVTPGNSSLEGSESQRDLGREDEDFE